MGDMTRWFGAVSTALCFLGASACLGENQPAEEKAPEAPAESAAQAPEPAPAESGDPTFGDGPVGGSAKGLPEADNYVVDSGFRPGKNGFLFPNGDRDERGQRIQFPVSSPGHLDKDGMQRLFGSEKVCLGLEEHEGECLLSPGAFEFMNMVNKVMNNGQCEGLAVFSLSLFSGKDPVDVFKDGATFASELEQDTIRGPVGYYFAYQFLQPFRNFLFGTMQQTTPNEVLDTVIASLKQNEDPVALEFFQRGVGGHAVVPYAVEDKGNGVFHVRIWDNNFPNASRYIEFDRNKNTWLYSFAAINPSQDSRPWGGGESPNTIVATPVSKRMDQPAVCPFCEDNTSVRMLMTAGGVNAMVTDSQGRKVGMENGQLVNEIPGANAYPVMSFVPGEPPPDPLIELPANQDYNVEIVGSGPGSGSIGVFGTDHAMVVEDINIAKGDKDVVNLSRDGQGIDYTPGSEGRKPKVRLAMGTGSDSYRVELDDLKPKKGVRMGFRLNRRTRSLAVTDGGKEVSDVRGRVTRFTKNGRRQSVKLDAPKRPGARGLSLSQLTEKAPEDKEIEAPRRKGPRMGPRRPTTKPDPKKPTDPRQPNPKKPVLTPRTPAPKPRGPKVPTGPGKPRGIIRK